MSNSSYGPSFPSSGEPEYAAAPPPGKRPGKLTAAVVISYVGSALALVLALIVVAGAGSQQAIDAVGDSGVDLSADEIAASIRISFGLFAALALAALIVTPFVAKGAGWARIVLTVLGAVGLIVSVLSLPLGLPWVAAIITTIVLMFLSDSSAYFKSRSRA